MTHDELLAGLDEIAKTMQENKLPLTSKYISALCAVVELHRPETITTPCPDGKPSCLVLHYSDKQKCSCGFWNYPCPTIQAIEKELK